MKILTLDCETQRLANEVEGGWNNIPGMGVAVVCAEWQTPEAHRYRLFTETVEAIPDSNELRNWTIDQFQYRLNTADLILTFNGERFDFPLLESAGFDMKHARTVHYDILVEYAKTKRYGILTWNPPYGDDDMSYTESSAYRISLQSLANALGVPNANTASALMPQYWQGAEYLRGLSKETPFMSRPSTPSRESCVASAARLYQAVVSHCLKDVKITRSVFDALIKNDGYVSLTDRSGGPFTVQFALPALEETHINPSL